MNRIIIFFTFLVSLTNQAFCCWVGSSLEFKVARSDLIITGEVVKHDDYSEYGLCYILINEVIKSDFEGINLNPGDKLPIKVSSTSNKISTAFWFNEGEKGVWLLTFREDYFCAPNPSYLVEEKYKDKIKELLPELKTSVEEAQKTYIPINEKFLQQIKSFKNMSVTDVANNVEKPEDHNSSEAAAAREYPVYDEAQKAYFDENGKKILDLKEINKTMGWNAGKPFNEGLSPFYFYDPKSGLEHWGYMDTQGKAVIKNKFLKAGPFTNGRAIAAKPGENEYIYGFINKKGEWINEPVYTSEIYFSEGLACVSTYIWVKNQPVNSKHLKTKKDALGYKLAKKWGYINKKGEPVIPFVFDRPGHFSNGLAIPEVNEVHEKIYTAYKVYLNKAGKLIYVSKRDVELYSNNSYWSSKSGKWVIWSVVAAFSIIIFHMIFKLINQLRSLERKSS